MASDGIAKPEDFKRAAGGLRQPERIVLPKSGLAVHACRLTPLRAFMQTEAVSGIDFANVSTDDRVKLAELMVSTIREILIEPRLALNPGLGEIDPNWLPQEDADYLFRWGLGLITSEGDDLSRFFRNGRGARTYASTAPGPAGGDVALPPERDPWDSRPHGGASD